MFPLAAAFGIAVLAVSAAVLRSVDCATYAVIFCLYTNLPAIAVRFHGAPAVVAHAVVGLLLIPLTYFIVIKRQPLIVGRAAPWIAGLAIVQLLGALFAEQPENAWDEFMTFMMEGLLLYGLLVNAIRDEQTLRGVLWSLLIAGVIMGGVPLYQQVTGTFDNNYGGFAQTGDEPGFSSGDHDRLQFRLAGPIGEKNRYAQIMLMLTPIGLLLMRQERSTLLKALAAAAFLFACAGVYLSFSRSTILCAGAMIGLAAIWGHVDRTKVFAVGILAFCALMITPEYRTRLTSLLELGDMFTAGRHSDADGALKGRATEMGAAALVFLDHPFVGVGPGQFKYYSREYGERIGLRSLAPERQAHCLPLDVAAENGLPGVICLFGLFLTLGGGLLRKLSLGDEARGLPAYLLRIPLYMLVAYGTTALFLHFAYIRYFWLMIALVDASLCIARRNEVEQRSESEVSAA